MAKQTKEKGFETTSITLATRLSPTLVSAKTFQETRHPMNGYARSADRFLLRT
jgi:hypothetical protein